MDTKEILKADYLDLIFNKRNKAYGSYDLRKNYKSRTLKSLGFVVGFVILSIGTPTLISRLNANDNLLADKGPKVVSPTLSDNLTYDIKPKVEPKPKIEKPAQKAIAATAKNDVPKIVKNNDVPPELKPPAVNDMNDKLAGPANNVGTPDGTEIAKNDKQQTGETGDGEGSDKGKIGGDDEGNDRVETAVDELPEFPGGMTALMAYLQSKLKYPTTARENDIQGRVLVHFVVGKDGEIEAAKILKGIGGGCEKEALRVVNAMPKWKPGKIKGKSVKTNFTLPISFRLG